MHAGNKYLLSPYYVYSVPGTVPGAGTTAAKKDRQGPCSQRIVSRELLWRRQTKQ